MAHSVRIRMMGNFVIYLDEVRIESIVSKSKKGVALMEYLILNRGASVPNAQLLSALWDDERSANPENALKTLVSRLRAQLNGIMPGLGEAIVADRGAYHWQQIPGLTVDVTEILELFDRFQRANERDDPALYNRLLKLYQGDLLQYADCGDWVTSYAASMHNQYMSAVYAYIDLLKQEEKWEEITAVCRTALDIDAFDDRLNIELMSALIKTDRTSDAMAQYKHVVHLNYHYLGIQPSEDMQEFYKQIVRAGKTLDYNLDSIRKELTESGDQYGTFFCEYAVFKEIYNLQMRNLERLGSNMFLGLIRIGSIDETELDSIKQDNLMNTMKQIMKKSLRKGDTVTQFSPTTFALLLPMVNYATGNMIMERLKREFFKRIPNSDIHFSYRIGPLSSGKSAENAQQIASASAPGLPAGEQKLASEAIPANVPVAEPVGQPL